MSESFIQLPAEGAGKKVRTIQKTVGADTVHVEQQIADSYWNFVGAYTISLDIAGSVNAGYQFLSLLNPNASGKILKIKSIKLMVRIGSVANLIQVLRSSDLGTGTSQTAVKKNSAYAASVASIRSVLTTNATVTYPFLGIAKGVTASIKLYEYVNWDAILERDQLVLRENEGIVVRQNVAGAATEFLDITIEWEEYITT